MSLPYEQFVTQGTMPYLAIRLIDRHTGKSPIGNVTLVMEGESIEPVHSANSYYLFLDLPGKAYTVKVNSDYYLEKIAIVDVNIMEPESSAEVKALKLYHEIYLDPNVDYPFEGKVIPPLLPPQPKEPELVLPAVVVTPPQLTISESTAAPAPVQILPEKVEESATMYVRSPPEPSPSPEPKAEKVPEVIQVIQTIIIEPRPVESQPIQEEPKATVQAETAPTLELPEEPSKAILESALPIKEPCVPHRYYCYKLKRYLTTEEVTNIENRMSFAEPNNGNLRIIYPKARYPFGNKTGPHGEHIKYCSNKPCLMKLLDDQTKK
jgi:hypothetical protein